MDFFTVTAQAIEDVEIEEVHCPEYEQDRSDLGTHQFQGRSHRVCRAVCCQCLSHIADIDQVKTDNQQMIHRCRKLCVSAKGIDEKDLAVPVKRSCNQDRRGKADGKVCQVGLYDVPCGLQL